MKKIIHHSRFSANPFGHGGERRTTQILEFYHNNGYESEALVLTQKLHFKLHYLLRSLLILLNVYGLKDWFSIKRFLKWWKKIYELLPALEKSFDTDAEIFVWESTSDSFYFLPYIAKKKGLTVFAYPHNIESLVRNQQSSITGKFTPHGYSSEIKVFRMCDKVFSISQFDNQLLLLFDINAELFSYIPPKLVVQQLSEIKKKRINKNGESKVKRYLVVGTVHNPPTRLGMEKLIQWLNINPVENAYFVIAGYGTEMLQDLVKHQIISILGSLTQQEMENEMIACDALLVYQIPTTGILTRVVEYNLAGIPVVINVEAGLNFVGIGGVNSYKDIQDLKILLNDIHHHNQSE